MPRLAVLLSTLFLALLVHAAPAAADGPPGMAEPTAPDPAPQTRTKRYGYQVFAADAGWFIASSLVAKADSGSGGGELIALGFYGGGPLVHLANHNPSGAAKSLALRALLPIGGAVGGMLIVGQDEDADGFGMMLGAIAGFGAGAIAAMVIDWTVIAKREVAVPGTGSLTLAGLRPGVKIGKQSATISLAGSF
jgi:hypothetical protein